MKQLTLITGPTQSGKTWLANCILAKYPKQVKIWDEPNLLLRKTRVEIKNWLKADGHAIITMTVPPSEPIAKFPNPDVTIMLYHRAA